MLLVYELIKKERLKVIVIIIYSKCKVKFVNVTPPG